jgi:uncharacterized protein YbjT (DUF2867 family)
MNTRIRNVLVHGSNGVQGSAIARRLCEEGFQVRAGVRNPAKSAALKAAGMDIVAADLESVSALRSACDGMDAVVLTLPLTWDREMVQRWAENAGRAARERGVGVMVLNCSTRIPAEPTEVPGFELRRTALSVLRDAGPPCIALCPPLFMDNLAGPWIANGIMRDRVLAYPLPEGFRVSWLAVEDLGGYVGAALRRREFVGRSFDIGGPEALDGSMLASEVSHGVGHAVRYFAVAPDAFERGLCSQFGPTVARGIAQTYYFAAQHADTALFTGSAAELTQELARPPMTMAQWARTQSWSDAALASA